MTSFGWKNKTGQKLVKGASNKFQVITGTDSGTEEENEEVDWVNTVLKRKSKLLLEDRETKSRRLQEEGSILADSERYWESLKKWDEAISLTPQNGKIYEMKAQVLMELGELFPSLQAAEQSVKCAPNWYIAYQTLGRAQLNLGDIDLALVSFCKAVHLHPDDRELRDNDLLWAHNLKKEKNNCLSSNCNATDETKPELISEDCNVIDESKIEENNLKKVKAR